MVVGELMAVVHFLGKILQKLTDQLRMLQDGLLSLLLKQAFADAVLSR